MNRNYVYAFPSVHGTCNVVNYRADLMDVNTFISNFDVWGSHGILRCAKIRTIKKFGSSAARSSLKCFTQTL